MVSNFIMRQPTERKAVFAARERQLPPAPTLLDECKAAYRRGDREGALLLANRYIRAAQKETGR